MSDIERPSGMDPAEGSRESIGERDDLGRDAQPGFSHGGTGHVLQPTGEDGDAGGITNRPLSEEEQEQEDVPDRGRRKDEG